MEIVQEQDTQVFSWVFLCEYLQLITYKHYTHLLLFMYVLKERKRIAAFFYIFFCTRPMTVKTKHFSILSLFIITT